MTCNNFFSIFGIQLLKAKFPLLRIVYTITIVTMVPNMQWVLYTISTSFTYYLASCSVWKLIFLSTFGAGKLHSMIMAFNTCYNRELSSIGFNNSVHDFCVSRRIDFLLCNSLVIFNGEKSSPGLHF